MGFSEFGEREGQGFWTEFDFERVCVMKTTLQEGVGIGNASKILLSGLPTKNYDVAQILDFCHFSFKEIYRAFSVNLSMAYLTFSVSHNFNYI